ncbi:baseplate wedge subunit [Aeromonas phage AS-yj]|uniref:Baseplate wedge subunit n=7 Tax=Caudoviricetes TaxID=2731619 RepID=A0A291LEG1_9CAUD|nr:baseplate wedge subunit [Aeromonas phage CC2]YP_009834662.1 baseplate wedge subunit [Aeromonas phage AS-zj]YP_009834896.1 baseplate wedge subunit [Aeromonas phage AS-sw]ATI17405.1 baseplate wedge subunit [Aeromonas phage AS-szw]ATI17689.1 baseplate wedge subunit [Aeromonas phage AS-yj]QAX97845.1 baseplate wedge subunit [Aeromonas phage Asswx_1]QAX99104.1 baseplate wedge subunit [Aeromonas phage Assk]QMV28801.1 tail lysozyme [Aeromonas phage AP1]UKM62887.1 putative baseplate wedge subunit
MAGFFGNRLKIITNEKTVYYTDIDPNFRRDIKTNDVLMTQNIGAVQLSMAGIIATRKREKPFDPDFGCDISAELFELMNDASTSAVERSIYDAIRNYEPRVKLRQVQVVPLYDRNEYIVSIYYSLITNLSTVVELKMELSNG